MKAIGKSVLLTTGFVWGLCATVRRDRSEESDEQEWEKIDGRLDRIERALDLAANRSLEADFVTRDELNDQLLQLKRRIDGEINSKFDTQSLSVEALRTMIRQTDGLLERVLSALGEPHEIEEDERVSISTE